jgi:GR25 family glycosyltransferase involved in LPS biosynthesis
MSTKLDELCLNFLKDRSEINGFYLIRHIRQTDNFELGMIIGDFLSKEYKNNYNILQEYAICAYYSNNLEKAYDINNEILELKGLNESDAYIIIFNQKFSLKNVANRYIEYDSNKVNKITNRKKKEFPLITLTITTCKRFDLFEKTINSFINCVEDIDMIDNFLCVDDNSSDEDREKMKKLYPFFTFHFKNVEDKGHIKSMNIIRNYVLETFQTPYILHIEDDWKFFCKRKYITDALDVLNENMNIGQCLFNKNYTETEEDVCRVKGGDFHVTKNGLRYYIHEFANTEDKKIEWVKKHGIAPSSYYWPHFSFRPSLTRTKVFKDIGEFNMEAPHFEMEYAYRYVNKGYVSAFFENLYCIHTGRLTSQINDKSVINAYSLNKEYQFSKEEVKEVEEVEEEVNLKLDEKIKTYVLNLDRRPDRWEDFVKNNSHGLKFLNYERFSAVDGNIIKNTTQLQRIFNNNDYNMKVGMVGCLMSHVKMYIQLIYSEYDMFCIFEDDIEISSNFQNKFLNIMKQLKSVDWDLVYLGHHERNKTENNLTSMPIIQKTNVYQSFKLSLGGTTGYLITKKGAQKLLDFISETGATNCIDTLQQKSSNILNVYYLNHNIIYSECVTNTNNIDTDIQYNHNSLSLSLETKVMDEIKFLKERGLTVLKLNYEDCLNSLTRTIEPLEFFIYVLEPTENIFKLIELCKTKSLKYYTIENKILFINYSSKYIERYYHSFKVNDKYSIDDCCL